MHKLLDKYSLLYLTLGIFTRFFKIPFTIGLVATINIEFAMWLTTKYFTGNWKRKSESFKLLNAVLDSAIYALGWWTGNLVNLICDQAL